MSPRPLRISALAALAALAGCGGSSSMPSSAQTGVQSHRLPPTAFNWLQPGIDSAHVADNTAETRLKTRNVTRLQNAWSFSTGAGIGWGIMVDVLYATCNLGLCVYNASTGAFLASMGGLGNGPPTISNGKVFFPCGLNRSAGVNNVCMYDL